MSKVEEVQEKWMARIKAGLTPEERSQFGKEYADAVAADIVSVQPMGPVDWDAVGQAFEQLRAYRRSKGIHCCMDGDCDHE